MILALKNLGLGFLLPCGAGVIVTFWGGLNSMGEVAATNWADNLVYGGYANWRLPDVRNQDRSHLKKQILVPNDSAQKMQRKDN